MHGTILVALFLAAPCAIFVVALFFRRVCVAPSVFRSALINAATLATTLVLTALVAESIFYFNVQSDGFGISLMQQRWDELYSGPRNSLGYRDREPHMRNPSKHFIVALGDSFTYGQGIKNIDDRYQNLLGRRIGKDWVPVTVAVPGWDTVMELEALKKLPRKPDVLILQYFVNDIQGISLAHGIDVAPSPRMPGFPLGPIVKHSYAADFIFWRLYGTLNEGAAQYWEKLTECYSDVAVWKEYEQVITNFCRYTQEQKIPTLVLIFPNLQSVDSSSAVTQKVSGAFRACGMNVLDLAPILANRSPRELVCSAYDAHPNQTLHREVSRLLYDKLKGLGWIPPVK